MSDKAPTIGTNLVIEGANGLAPSKCKSDSVNIALANFFQKKIIFNSAFDHKGSKQFLHSKKEALEKIIINDSDNISNNDSDTQNESNKQKKLKLKKTNRQKKQVKSSVNLLYFSNNLLNNGIPRKTRGKNKESKKSNLIRISATKGHKKNNKYSSSLELKMLKDKEIKKIKPIKKTTNFFDETKNKFFPFVDSERSDNSSLFNIVSQIQ